MLLIPNSFGFTVIVIFFIGIPYLPPVQEQKIRDALANKHKMETEALSKNGSSKSNGQKPIEVPKEEEKFIADIQ